MKNGAVKKPAVRGCAKVPVIMQMEALECGAACLAMVLAYYGKWVPLERVRADCGVSRDGSNAGNMLTAARRYGLMAQGYRYEPQRLREKGTFPCIIHWNFNHFVVLCGFRGKKAVLNDPARGTLSVSMEEFDRAFTGVCIMFAPGKEFVPGGKPESVLAFVKKRLKGTAGAMVFVLLTTVVISIIGIINPVFSRIFIDRLLSGRNLPWLYPFIACMAGVAAIQIVVLALRAANLLKIEGKFAISANASFLWHLLRLPVGFYAQRMAGDLADRQKVNETIASSLISQLAPLALGFCMMIFYLVIMLRYSVLLTAVGVCSIVINLFLAQLISKKRVNITRVMARDAGKLAGATVSGISMMETIKASGAENGFFAKWAGYQAAVNTQNVKYAHLNQYLGAVPGIVSSLANIAILSLGVYLTMEGQFTVGMILAFQGFMSSFASPAADLITAGQSLQELRTNMERTEDVMRYPVDTPDDSAVPLEQSCEKLSGRISVKNITFGYSPLGAPLIRDFSMELAPGKSVALVGASGSGKSTLAKLIAGLYRPWSGEILFDDKRENEIGREAFTASLSMVDQDIVIFEDTIANNIRLWDDGIDDAEMVRAAKDAQIHEDIMKRDGGYESRVAEGGKDLSGGQRQRLEIARMLAQDPSIAILDEATSALDAKTECAVLRALARRRISYIVVAHRLSAVRDCDEIIVIDHGEAAERGTHEELMERDGLYAKLISNE
ncbi:MAG: NHLP family bacteriocin export ABC transporter peptidase/permease/ATPase subunit [Christensenella sp.]|nr:NHLP family bacteriocin export ABC transporter peptidase/permease/ATPase subunit [Christensenella sp.]